MNADNRRWIRLATVAPLIAAVGEIHCLAADVTPPSERRPAKGVAEYSDEFADAEQSRKPLIQWTLPFTQYVAAPFPTGQRMHGAIGRPRPKVRLDQDNELLGMKPTPVELLIEDGFPSGERESAPSAPDDSNHLAEEVFTFNISFSR